MASSNKIWFGSFGPFVFNEDLSNHKDVMMEESTLIFPSTFVRRELDIIFGSYNRHEKGAIQVPSDTRNVLKDSTLIVRDELIVSGELNIKFGTFGSDHKREIKDLKDGEKASFNVVEDIDRKMEVQNYLMKVLKLDQDVNLENPNKFVSSYEEELMETRSLGLCRDRVALHYLCSNKAGRFVARWISDEEYLQAVETRKMRSSCVEERISADQNEEILAGENAIELEEKEEIEIDLKLKEQCLVDETVKENEAIEKNKRNADVARVQAEARDQNVAEQKETAEIFLEQRTQNDVANEITSNPAVSSVVTRMPVLCVEEVHVEDQCNEIVAENNNKHIMKNEESAEPIVTSGIINDTKQEKVFEINEEIESKERVDEDAKLQAEVQAQKEAKKKEKAQLKRLRNKERKRAAISNNKISYQDVVESNGSKELHKSNEEENVYEIRIEEVVPNLKVQHWLEVTKKINEAIESNEGVDEEAQMQDEVRPQKEAKKKDKARLKRLRNKEKKRAAISNNKISYQDVVDSSGSKELHNTNEEKSQRRPSRFSLMLSNFKTIMSPSTVILAVRKILLALTIVLTLFTITVLH
ncbi:uncharacterized protein [Rutidosis leptorrhynchoides]|uniref:uncharacterized protein n=1 Tax=Rutidosis leptorrhynchoides TaxID=125765 RepID=UPI003A99B652